MSPALQGKFLTTGPPGKSLSIFFFYSLINAPCVTSPGTHEGTHSFTSYILRPYHVPGTEQSKMAEIIPALENLPARS